MKCNENKIMDFIDDKLTEEKAHEFEEHLKQCKPCKSIYNRLMILENMDEDKEVFKVDLADKVMASIGENIYANQKNYIFKDKFINKGNHFLKYVAVALIALVITTGIVVGKDGELLNYFKGGNKEEIGAKNNTEDSNKTLGINIDKLIKYKNSYVGDNSAVGGILTNLPGSKFINEFSLQTDSEPYGIEVNYKPQNNLKSSEEFSKLFNEKDTENILMDNAITLFILVTNVDEIKFNLKEREETTFTFSITRREVETFYGRDMTAYAEDKGLWEKEIINSKARPRQATIYPEIHITCEEKEVAWSRGNSNYTSGKNVIIGSTSFGDPEAWDALSTTTVKPNAVINFKADEVEGLDSPAYKVYSRDEMMYKSSEYPSSKGSMKAPAEEGNYYFAILCDWGKGDHNIEYWIKIKVEK